MGFPSLGFPLSLLMRRFRRISLISSASNVKSSITMLYSVVIQRKEDIEPQLLMLMKKLNMKKVKPLQLMSRKEKVKEESFMTGKTKVEDQDLF